MSQPDPEGPDPQSGRPGPDGLPPDEADVGDPALGRERTELAWTRSSISFAALGILFLKFRPAIGVLILLFSTAIWLIGRVPRQPGGAAPRRILMVTIIVAGLALVALVLTLVGHSSGGLRSY